MGLLPLSQQPDGCWCCWSSAQSIPGANAAPLHAAHYTALLGPPTCTPRPPAPGGNWAQQHVLQGCFNPAPGGCNPVQDLQCPDPELSRRNSQINGVGGFVQ